MNILVTGSNGFLGKNLIARINAAGIGSVLPFDLPYSENRLKEHIKKADFIFHLAGVNRPDDKSEFYTGNSGLTETIVRLIEADNVKIPITFISSAQVGNDSDYAISKEMAEKILLDYQKDTGTDVFIYRFPGIFGKWSRPDYNTVVATFCYNIANNLPIEIHNMEKKLTLCYIDDIVDILLKTLSERRTQEIKPQYTITLGKLAATIGSFAKESQTPEISDLSDPLTKKLYATYLSFLPADKISYPLTTHNDERGSFTEFLHLPKHGQVSVNVSKPGITKGDHWHDTKHEKFLVVSGQGIIKLRMLNSQEKLEYHVSGNEPEVIDIPPGYTHSITNSGDEDMITVMWASEIFDKSHPDTFYEKVEN